MSTPTTEHPVPDGPPMWARPTGAPLEVTGPAPGRRWFTMKRILLPATAVSFLFVGLMIGVSGTPPVSPAAQAAPAPAVTVAAPAVTVAGPAVTVAGPEVTVAGPATVTTPQACLDALTAADQAFTLAGNGFTAAADGFAAVSNLDVPAMTEATGRMTEASSQIKALAPTYLTAKAACQAAQ
jgi:hypothetical protein